MSPSFNGTGSGGLYVVSRTSKEGGEPPFGVGNISLIGTRTKALNADKLREDKYNIGSLRHCQRYLLN
jgi:hypothetical protein